MGPLSILCFVYGISLFYRGMISVIAPELSTDLALDESSLGLLSSTFFISFAIAQVPSGLALDRWGGRLTIGLFMWFAVLGTAVFWMADGYALALVGQVLPLAALVICWGQRHWRCWHNGWGGETRCWFQWHWRR